MRGKGGDGNGTMGRGIALKLSMPSPSRSIRLRTSFSDAATLSRSPIFLLDLSPLFGTEGVIYGRNVPK